MSDAYSIEQEPDAFEPKLSGRTSPPLWWEFVSPLLGLSVFAAAIPGYVFQPDAWWDALRKPPWVVPDAWFVYVWPALYAMMAVALWLVLRQAFQRPIKGAVSAWVAQLALNAAWSYLFFELHGMAIGLVDLLALHFLIFTSMVLSWRVSKIARALLVPYFVWVGYALFLNFSIWALHLAADNPVN